MTAFIIQTLIWLLIAFILGLLIGRFLRKLFCKESPATAYAGASISTRSASGGAAAMATPATAGATAVAATADAAVPSDVGRESVDVSASMAASAPVVDADIGSFRSDNLQIIEGIGPKMESVLHENGIVSWSELGNKSESDLRGILDQYGDKYQMIEPAIWIPQAKLASEGKVDELIKLQKEDGVSKLENMMGASDHSGFGGYKKDDLKIVEGIGPKIEQLLNAAGFNTWLELSKADAAKVQGILDAAGPNFRLADPESWALQAELANNGEWAKLKEYQDILQGGRSH